MTTELQAAEKAIRDVAGALGKEVPPELVSAAAGMLVGIVASLTGAAVKKAAAEGAAHATVKVTDVESAEAAARERNK